jgi:hypothetical protein
MSNAALFQILYQNETLFHLKDSSASILTEHVEKLIEKAPIEPAVVKPVATPVVQKPILPTTPAVPVITSEFPPLQHKILILIDEPKQESMLPSEAAFLNNILKAVGHSTDHSDVLNFSFLPGTDARKVFKDKKTNFFITFGVPLIKLNLDLLLAPYMPKNIDGVWFLLADPLVVIEADRNLKKKLWQALQKMFEMS